MRLSFILVVCIVGLAASQEPTGYPLSVSPILIDSAPFQEGLGLATIKTVPAGTFLLDRTSAVQANISFTSETLSLWKPPAAIPVSPPCYSTSTSGYQFYQVTSDRGYLVMDKWSAPTTLYEATQHNIALTTSFFRQSDETTGGFIGMLKFYYWHLVESSAQLNPLNLFQPNNNMFFDPVVQEPFININTSRIDPLPYIAPNTTIDLPQFYPVLDIVSSGNYTHIAIQSGNSVKLFSFDLSWNLLRKSIIIPAGGVVRQGKQEPMPLFDAGISLAADETTGGVYVVVNGESSTLNLVEVLLGFEVFGDNVTSALFWIPPPPAYTHPINATTIDMIFFSYIKVPACSSIWPVITAFNHRVVATGLCRIGSYPGNIAWSQMLWVADLSYHNHQASATIVRRQSITWDHRGTGTESRVNDVVMLEGGEIILVAGSTGFVAPSVTVAGGDAFVSLFNISSGQEISQARFGVQGRNNGASGFVFSPISPSTDPALIHTAPLSFFPFRILTSVSLNGPVGTDEDPARYSTGAIYEVKFSPCSFSNSVNCAQAGYSPVSYALMCGGGPASNPSDGGGSNKGVIAGAVIGSLAAVALLGFLVHRFVLQKKRFHATATYDHHLESETTDYRQL